MKTLRLFTVLVLFMSLVVFACESGAEEKISITGKVKEIDLNTHIVIVTTYNGNDIPIVVEDSETLKKFKERRIKIDDDVKVRYIIMNNKNLAIYFKKAAGC